MEDDYKIFDGLKGQLNEYEWPSLYMFKFIVPLHTVEKVLELLKDAEPVSKPSKNGNYIALTFKIMMQSPQDIIEVYVKAAKIEGVIAL